MQTGTNGHTPRRNALWQFVVGYPKLTIRNPEKCDVSFAIALADACKDDTQLSKPVERIVIENGAVKGVTTKTGFFEADAVICAKTAKTALQITPDMPDNIRRHLEKVNYSSCCHVAFGFDGNPLPKPTYIFTIVPRTDLFIAAFFDSVIASPLAAPPGKGLIHGYSVEEHADELFAGIHWALRSTNMRRAGSSRISAIRAKTMVIATRMPSTKLGS